MWSSPFPSHLWGLQQVDCFAYQSKALSKVRWKNTKRRGLLTYDMQIQRLFLWILLVSCIIFLPTLVIISLLIITILWLLIITSIFCYCSFRKCLKPWGVTHPFYECPYLSDVVVCEDAINKLEEVKNCFFLWILFIINQTSLFIPLSLVKWQGAQDEGQRRGLWSRFSLRWRNLLPVCYHSGNKKKTILFY